MPRRSGGKTETIKQRAVYVYLPSLGMMEDWKQRADKAGSSISKFVVERVEDSLRRDTGDEGSRSRLKLLQPPLASLQQQSCSVCGKSNIIEADYCSSCGHKLEVAQS